jgi:antitoxin MazE
MKTRIATWGNSLGVRIPRAVAEDAGVRSGALVDLGVEGRRIVVRPLDGKAYRLKDLLARVTAANVHGEIDTGRPLGRESW